MDDKKDDQDFHIREPVMFMGRNINDIPCFKTVFQTGVISGLTLGLGTFMFTSRVKRATDIGFYSFVGITFFYWCYCRYQFSKDRFKYQQVQYAMRYGTQLEGTNKKLDDVVGEDA
ncbi:cytochrome c oxidase assembly protein COX20, mitochondrial-like [Ornithodoros turicata]